MRGMKNNVKHVIWDWNGTLLDDLDICLEGVNRLLERRKLPLLDRVRYMEIFTFPIRHYYEAAGFDFESEPFEVPAEEFIVEYKKILNRTRLFPDVAGALEMLHSKGIKQFVLSAMEEQALRGLVKQHGIDHYFEEICGISDNFAVSKAGRGKQMIRQHGMQEADTLLVGDTLHDAEVADALGMNVLLIGRGHQHPDRLIASGQPILYDLVELLSYLWPVNRAASETEQTLPNTR